MIVKAELRKIGAAGHPLVILDELAGDPADGTALACALAPFPAAGTLYPGLRRVIRDDDGKAMAYMARLCEAAAPYIGGAFETDGFDLIEASFSMVTTSPGRLLPPQRAPHFDSTDPAHVALLLYLRGPLDAGTAFYRHRATGIEKVTDANAARFVDRARVEAERADADYIRASDPFYEQIASVEAVPGRLIAYQGSLLHSGIIPPGLDLSDRPLEGRLTANLFLRLHRETRQ